MHISIKEAKASFSTLKQYCKQTKGCNGCAFESERGCVFIQHVPEKWEDPKHGERRNACQ